VGEKGGPSGWKVGVRMTWFGKKKRAKGLVDVGLDVVEMEDMKKKGEPKGWKDAWGGGEKTLNAWGGGERGGNGDRRRRDKGGARETMEVQPQRNRNIGRRGGEPRVVLGKRRR